MPLTAKNLREFRSQRGPFSGFIGKKEWTLLHDEAIDENAEIAQFEGVVYNREEFEKLVGETLNGGIHAVRTELLTALYYRR